MFRRFVSTAPPPRRGKLLPRLRQRPPPPVAAVNKQDDFNAPLYTFKAFAIATAIAMLTATASVAGVMAYLDVHSTTEFASHMRTWVSQSMPLLTAKIYRHPTAQDSVPGDPVLLAASLPQSSQTTFDHDAAQQRLTEAFDEGGLGAWAEAAVREMEAEMEVERSRKRIT